MHNIYSSLDWSYIITLSCIYDNQSADVLLTRMTIISNELRMNKQITTISLALSNIWHICIWKINRHLDCLLCCFTSHLGYRRILGISLNLYIKSPIRNSITRHSTFLLYKSYNFSLYKKGYNCIVFCCLRVSPILTNLLDLSQWRRL